jgi:large subunit ribosomal protein L30
VAKIRITLVKSGIGHKTDQRRTLDSLGLRHINRSVVKEDSLTLRGQVMKVKHLVTVEEETNVTE